MLLPISFRSENSPDCSRPRDLIRKWPFPGSGIRLVSYTPFDSEPVSLLCWNKYLWDWRSVLFDIGNVFGRHPVLAFTVESLGMTEE